jgi:cold shock CspA family protein
MKESYHVSSNDQNSKDAILRGVIKWYSSEKGYGFITPESGDETFFHESEYLAEEPSTGQSVKYELRAGKRGPCATNVTTAAA